MYRWSATCPDLETDGLHFSSVFSSQTLSDLKIDCGPLLILHHLQPLLDFGKGVSGRIQLQRSFFFGWAEHLLQLALLRHSQ